MEMTFFCLGRGSYLWLALIGMVFATICHYAPSSVVGLGFLRLLECGDLEI